MADSGSADAIRSLMFRYAECVDTANFAGLGELFEHGRMLSDRGEEQGMGGDEIPAFYARTNKVHENGTLRTRHISANIIFEIDEDADEARVRSVYVVCQAAGKLPLQPIVAGRYRDRFVRVDGEWRFAERMVLVDLIGDMREHLSFDLSKQQSVDHQAGETWD